MNQNLWRLAAALSLSMATGACTYGMVTDAEGSGEGLGGVRITFQRPNLGGSAMGDVSPTLSAGIWVNTWSITDPGAGDADGTYYLNPYGTFNDGDNRDVFVGSGWQRAVVSKTGYDTRRFYRNHQLTKCNVSAQQGPYSAGPYPYVAALTQPYITSMQTQCTQQNYKLYKSTSNYLKDPDMIVDVRSLRDWEISSTNCETATTGSSRCLRLSVGTANVGDGDLWLRGNSNSAGVTQRRFRRDGTIESTSLPNAVFEFHPTHHHIHLQNWTNLRLRKRDSTCSSEATAGGCPIVGVPGQKISFCLTETDVFDSSYTPNPARARSCGYDSATGEINQGIGSGQEDTYGKWLTGQMIGIDGLPAGNYWLEVEVNPANANGQRTVLESDYTNNITRLAVTL